MIYKISEPRIDSVTITPNPVNANSYFLISVLVSEIEIILEPITIYSGTFNSGQEVIL